MGRLRKMFAILFAFAVSANAKPPPGAAYAIGNAGPPPAYHHTESIEDMELMLSKHEKQKYDFNEADFLLGGTDQGKKDDSKRCPSQCCETTNVAARKDERRRLLGNASRR